MTSGSPVQLQLCHANGDVAVTVDVDLNVDEIAGRVNSAYTALGAAQAELQKNEHSETAIDAYGNAVLAVFKVIFGEEGAEKIVSFYEQNYTEMLLDLFPFISDEIMPKIKAASAERREQLVAAAKSAKQSNRGDRRRWRR